MRRYVKHLPEGYKEIYSLDASNAKIGIIMNIVALLIMVIIVSPILFFITRGNSFSTVMNELFEMPFLTSGILLISLAMYVVLHELIHGVAYYALTKHKLTFGLTLAAAFCGVPDIYVSKKTALIAVLSPFIVFDIMFVTLILLLPTMALKILATILFGVHFSGCVGDLHCTYLLLLKFKSKDILMKDTGLKQIYYDKIKGE